MEKKFNTWNQVTEAVEILKMQTWKIQQQIE